MTTIMQPLHECIAVWCQVSHQSHTTLQWVYCYVMSSLTPQSHTTVSHHPSLSAFLYDVKSHTTLHWVYCYRQKSSVTRKIASQLPLIICNTHICRNIYTYIYILCMYIFNMRIYKYIYIYNIERGASPARAIFMQNTGFSEVTLCHFSAFCTGFMHCQHHCFISVYVSVGRNIL